MADSLFLSDGVSPYIATTTPPIDGEIAQWSDALNAWTNSTAPAGSGDVTASGTLTNNVVIVGGGTTVVKATTSPALGTPSATTLGVHVTTPEQGSILQVKYTTALAATSGDPIPLLITAPDESTYHFGILNTTFSQSTDQGFLFYQADDGTAAILTGTSTSLVFDPVGQIFCSVPFGIGVQALDVGAILAASYNQSGDTTNVNLVNGAIDSNGKDSDFLDGCIIDVAVSGDSVTGHVSSYYSHQAVTDTATVDRIFGFYHNPAVIGVGTTVSEAFAFYSSTMVGQGDHPYFLWYDGGGGDVEGGGVFRVNELGIIAYYNPAFTTYTPGSANFERELIRWGNTGTYGTDNVAYMGVEVGGTGTNRNLNLLGAEVGVMTIPGTYGVLRAGGYKSSDGSAGATGTATAANTLTIKNGLVTVIA